MGERGQVKIGKVYLYTHWGAYDLIEAVQRALAKHWRWNDEEYLTRIIFEEMIGNERLTETGFGIGTIKHEDIWRFIEIKGNKVIVKDYGKEKFTGTFEEFLEYKQSEEEDG